MNEDKDINWAPDLPYMEVREFLVHELREPGSEELDRRVCELLDVSPVVPCTRDLMAAVSMIPDGWWWNIDHHSASVTPTVPVEGAPVSNGTMYDWHGRPVSFGAMSWSREELPVAMCEALIKARYDLPDALVVEKSATEVLDYRRKYQKASHQRQHPPKDTIWRRLRIAWGTITGEWDRD